MPAYIVTEIEVHDHERYEAYKKISSSSVQAYGGRFIVRGGKVQKLEGEWSPQRLVIIEFPSADRATEWWNSPEYAPGKKIRQETAHSEMIVIDGI